MVDPSISATSVGPTSAAGCAGEGEPLRTGIARPALLTAGWACGACGWPKPVPHPTWPGSPARPWCSTPRPTPGIFRRMPSGSTTGSPAATRLRSRSTPTITLHTAPRAPAAAGRHHRQVDSQAVALSVLTHFAGHPLMALITDPPVVAQVLGQNDQQHGRRNVSIAITLSIIVGRNSVRSRWRG